MLIAQLTARIEKSKILYGSLIGELINGKNVSFF